MKNQVRLVSGIYLIFLQLDALAVSELPTLRVTDKSEPSFWASSGLDDRLQPTHSLELDKLQGMASRIEDLADYLPGVQVERLNAGSASDVSIHGFRLGGRFLLDGLLDNQTNFVRDFSTLERIDYVNAKNGALYGAGAPTGNINFIRKKPLYSAQHLAQVTLGNFQQKRLVLDNTAPLTAHWAYRSVLALQNSDTWKDNVTDNAVNWLGSLLWQKQAQQLLFNVEWSEQQRPYDFDNVYAFSRPIYGVSYVHPQSYADRKTLRLDADYQLELNANNRVQFQIARASSHQDERQIGFWYYLDDDSALPGYYREVNNRFAQNTLKAHWQHQLTPAQQLTLGVDHHDTAQTFDDWYRGGTFSLNILNPVFNQPLPTATQLRPLQGHVTYQEQALFMGHQWQLSPAWQLNTHVRQSEFKLDYTQNNRSSPAEGKPFTYGLGISYALATDWQGYLLRNTSYAPNSGISASGSTFEPLLGQQTALGLIKRTAQQTFSAQIYDASQDNQLFPDPSNPTYKIPIGSLQAQGIEGNWQQHLSSHWQLRLGFHHFFNTKLVSNDDNNGNRFPNIPKDSGTASVHYQQGKWQAMFSMLIQDAKAGDAANSFYVQGYTRFDTWVRWQENPYRSWQLSIRNLTNIDYVNNVTGVDYVRFGDPRLISLTMTQRF